MQHYQFQPPTSNAEREAPRGMVRQRPSRPSLPSKVAPPTMQPRAPPRVLVPIANIAPVQQIGAYSPSVPVLQGGAIRRGELAGLPKAKKPPPAAPDQFVFINPTDLPRQQIFLADVDPLPTPRGGVLHRFRQPLPRGVPPLKGGELPPLTGYHIAQPSPLIANVDVSDEQIMSEIPSGEVARPYVSAPPVVAPPSARRSLDGESPRRASSETVERRRKQALLGRLLSNAGQDEAQKANAELMSRYRLIAADVNEIERRQIELRRHMKAIRSSSEHSAARHRYAVEQLQEDLDNTAKLSAERVSIQNLYKGKPRPRAVSVVDEDCVRMDGDDDEGGDLASSHPDYATESYLPQIQLTPTPQPPAVPRGPSVVAGAVDDVVNRITAFYQEERMTLLRSGQPTMAERGMRQSTAATIDAEARRYQLKAEADAKREAKLLEEAERGQRAQEQAAFNARKIVYRNLEQERRREEARHRERLLREEARLESKSRIAEKDRRVEGWKFYKQHKSPLPPMAKMMRPEDF